MKVQRTGDLKLIQELNRSIIIRTIKQNGPISRSEISKILKISPTTVTAAARELIKEGLVEEIGIGESSGGRRPILLKFSGNSRFIIAVVVTDSSIKIAEANLECEINKKSVSSVNNLKGDAFVEHLLKAIGKFLKNYSSLEKIIGISVTFPGIVGVEEGMVYESTKLKLHDIPMKKIIEQEFKLKVWLENDTNAILLVLKSFNLYRKFKNLVYITIGEGLGAGILINGDIYRGYGGASGELGHTSIDINGISCDCGNRGCIENYVNWSAICSRIMENIKKGKKTKILSLAKGNIDKITPSILNAALKQKDELAMQVIKEVAVYLGTGVSNLVNLLNPDAIVFGGEVAFGNNALISEVKKVVFQKSLGIAKKKLKIYLIPRVRDFDYKASAAIPMIDFLSFTI